MEVPYCGHEEKAAKQLQIKGISKFLGFFFFFSSFSFSSSRGTAKWNVIYRKEIPAMILKGSTALVQVTMTSKGILLT